MVRVVVNKNVCVFVCVLWFLFFWQALCERCNAIMYSKQNMDDLSRDRMERLNPEGKGEEPASTFFSSPQGPRGGNKSKEDEKMDEDDVIHETNEEQQYVREKTHSGLKLGSVPLGTVEQRRDFVLSLVCNMSIPETTGVTAFFFFLAHTIRIHMHIIVFAVV